MGMPARLGMCALEEGQHLALNMICAARTEAETKAVAVQPSGAVPIRLCTDSLKIPT